ncbi:hypothetical protein STPYR_12588 [uncultured Stenotrophomonas sp.]|uniref:Uncharacterized protein n=1 Tax=uncultured Stenotrophomonas sp. TaxID=165438 RepID=A0A1Y5Q8Z4_9GAMM|nr:hypothetical protein STPYR_12588 [uncultured Stenotrophomonas sp.]
MPCTSGPMRRHSKSPSTGAWVRSKSVNKGGLTGIFMAPANLLLISL